MNLVPYRWAYWTTTTFFLFCMTCVHVQAENSQIETALNKGAQAVAKATEYKQVDAVLNHDIMPAIDTLSDLVHEDPRQAQLEQLQRARLFLITWRNYLGAYAASPPDNRPIGMADEVVKKLTYNKGDLAFLPYYRTELLARMQREADAVNPDLEKIKLDSPEDIAGAIEQMRAVIRKTLFPEQLEKALGSLQHLEVIYSLYQEKKYDDGLLAFNGPWYYGVDINKPSTPYPKALDHIFQQFAVLNKALLDRAEQGLRSRQR